MSSKLARYVQKSKGLLQYPPPPAAWENSCWETEAGMMNFIHKESFVIREK